MKARRPVAYWIGRAVGLLLTVLLALLIIAGIVGLVRLILGA